MSFYCSDLFASRAASGSGGGGGGGGGRGGLSLYNADGSSLIRSS